MISFLLHLDENLIFLIQAYGSWIYSIVFIVIFCETGLVFAPFLPGDSLLFILGTLASMDLLDIRLVIIMTLTAAIIGDSVNYQIGKILGPKIFNSEKSRWFNKEYLTRTQQFYEKYGAKTLVIARFTPIIRTFAPFVAGIGKMPYQKFLFWNITGGALWVLLLTLGGYLFGNIPFVQDNLALIIFGIVVVSFIPAIVTYIQERKSSHV